MQRVSKSALAALLITAVLSGPGGALAAGMAEPPAMTKPAPAMPVPDMPIKPPDGEGMVEIKVTREEAIALARSLFVIPEHLGEPNVGIHQSRTGAAWSLEWVSSSKRPDQMRINVSIDAVTGTVVGYHSWSNQVDESLPLSFTRDEAGAVAAQWFAKLVPAEQAASLKALEMPLNITYWGGTTYQFMWTRQVQGYPVQTDGVTVGVDARTGMLTDFSLNWRTDATYTLPEKVLSASEAASKYAGQLPMILQYQRFQKRGTDQTEWRLTYRPLTGGFPSMDQAGTILDWNGKPHDLKALTRVKPVPAPDTPYTKPAEPLGREAALAVARKALSRSDEPTSASYSEYGEEVKTRSWDFSWLLPPVDGQYRGEMRVRINVDTGLVFELSNWSEVKPFEKGEAVPVSREQAEANAIAFLRSLRPDLAGNLQLRNEPEYQKMQGDWIPTEYYLSFQFLKNGIEVAGSGVSLSVSARTGEVRSFWAYNGEMLTDEFPDHRGVISPERAMAAFMQVQGIEATWSSFWSPETGQQSGPVLVYMPARTLNTSSIDARTGAPLDWEGRNLAEAMRRPTDIVGHFAEREIELLWGRGVFELADGKFNPDHLVSAEELARWIVLTRGMRPYGTYDFAMGGAGRGMAEKLAANAQSAYFGAAMQSGIMLPAELELIGELAGPVSRELFALWAIRAMGYGRLAKMEARINLAFADKDAIGAPYRNAVAILAGLGVVKDGEGVTFGPQRSLTRGEAAKILFAVSAERRN